MYLENISQVILLSKRTLREVTQEEIIPRERACAGQSHAWTFVVPETCRAEEGKHRVRTRLLSGESLKLIAPTCRDGADFKMNKQPSPDVTVFLIVFLLLKR